MLQNTIFKARILGIAYRSTLSKHPANPAHPFFAKLLPDRSRAISNIITITYGTSLHFGVRTTSSLIEDDVFQLRAQRD